MIINIDLVVLEEGLDAGGFPGIEEHLAGVFFPLEVDEAELGGDDALGGTLLRRTDVTAGDDPEDTEGFFQGSLVDAALEVLDEEVGLVLDGGKGVLELLVTFGTAFGPVDVKGLAGERTARL